MYGWHDKLNICSLQKD